MSKAPRTSYQASLVSSAMRGAVMAYAGDSKSAHLMVEAMSRLQVSRDILARVLRCPETSLIAANIKSNPEIGDRLRSMLAIIDRLSEWTKDDRASLAWYEDETIPAFGQTAADVVASGHGAAVLDYLEGLAVGGFA